MTKSIYQTQIGDFNIEVLQHSFDSFTVIYETMTRGNLDYLEASKELGECIFHALGCEGKLDTKEI